MARDAKVESRMRPQLRSASRNTVLGFAAALALIVSARFAGARVVRDRCIAGAQAITLAAGKTVGEALPPGGEWTTGALDANAVRSVSYRQGGETWEWKCLDEATRPGFTAVSARARELTPDRSFPADDIPEPRRP
jgi:hypothetical protein